MERNKDLLLHGNVRPHSAGLGRLLAPAGQQVQQDADRQVRLPPHLTHLLHDLSHPHQLHAHLPGDNFYITNDSKS